LPNATTADLYLDAVGFVADGRFEFAKASQLPAIIANEHQELVNGKQLMKKETAECRKLQIHYCEVVSHVVIINTMTQFIVLNSCLLLFCLNS